MGQELTARTKYRGLVKKRLIPVKVSGRAPQIGTPVTVDGREAGEVRSSAGNMALALLRLEQMEKAKVAGISLLSGDTVLTPHLPEWQSI